MTRPSGRVSPIRVGFLGAGPVTQAIHLPTLGRLGARFRVTRVMDADPAVARAVAGTAAAAWTTDERDVLDDADIDVVVVCSPDRFHADQVIAACRAGKRAVLCEKPLTRSRPDARRIADVVIETGTPLVVGTMHVYDPGWVGASAATPVVPHTIRSSIVLPPNPGFEDAATQIVGRTPGPVHAVDSARARADAVVDGILGLAIHDLPLVRVLLGRSDDRLWRRVRVASARFLPPFGYDLVMRAGDVVVELHAVMGDVWAPDWRLTAIADADALDIAFTPSYVHAGSATATLHHDGRATTLTRFDHNGYEAEWLRVEDIVAGRASPPPTTELVDDLDFALDIAGQARELLAPGTAGEAR